MQENKNCLSYWFPKLKAANLPVPKTTILEMSDKDLENIYWIFDGEKISIPFFKEAEKAALDIGFPVFLRSGQTSAKHDWSTTCFTCTVPDIKEHILNIIYFSACVGVPDTKIIVVREMLPIQPIGICLNYMGMPVNREFRYFVKDGKIICKHPYWPRESLEKGKCLITNQQYKDLCEFPDVDHLAIEASKVVDGYWSVDLLETADGWYITDMAKGEDSFHWKDCEMDFYLEEKNV